MSCDLGAGRAVPCLNAVGGIRTVYVGNYKDIPVQAGFAVDASDATEIDTLATAAQTFYTFNLRKEMASLTINIATDPASGTTYHESSLSLTFNNFTPADLDKFVTLAQGRPNVFVHDNNDNIWLLGARDGVEMSTGSGATGQGFGDANGFTIELTAKDNVLYHGAKTAGVTTANYPFDNVSGVTVSA